MFSKGSYTIENLKDLDNFHDRNNVVNIVDLFINDLCLDHMNLKFSLVFFKNKKYFNLKIKSITNTFLNISKFINKLIKVKFSSKYKLRNIKFLQVCLSFSPIPKSENVLFISILRNSDINTKDAILNVIKKKQKKIYGDFYGKSIKFLNCNLKILGQQVKGFNAYFKKYTFNVRFKTIVGKLIKLIRINMIPMNHKIKNKSYMIILDGKNRSFFKIKLINCNLTSPCLISLTELINEFNVMSKKLFETDDSKEWICNYDVNLNARCMVFNVFEKGFFDYSKKVLGKHSRDTAASQVGLPETKKKKYL